MQELRNILPIFGLQVYVLSSGGTVGVAAHFHISKKQGGNSFMENRYYRTFDNEQDLQNEMDRLRAEGYTDEDMYVMSKREDRMSIYRGHNDHEGHEKEGLWEKFKEFVTGDDESNEHFNRMSFEESERKQYYDDVNNGKHLLYADREYGRRPI